MADQECGFASLQPAASILSALGAHPQIWYAPPSRKLRQIKGWRAESGAGSPP